MPAGALHTAELLSNSLVLVPGGAGATGVPARNSALDDPASGTWSSTASLATARVAYTMTVLADGRVLVVGGTNGSANLSSTEVYGGQPF